MTVSATRAHDPRTRPDFRPRPFHPSPWLPGPHAQTLGGKLLRPPARPPLHRVRIETPDQDFLDLDFGPDPGPGAPVVLVLHGLEGSSRRRYALAAYEALVERGIHPVGLNFRGCSGEPNRRARFYHSGETGDVAFVLEELRRRYRKRPLGALGFSLGGNVLLKLLGEDRPTGGILRAAAAISVPFDLEAGARRLEEGVMGTLYTHYFLRMLRRKVRAKRSLLEDRIEVGRGLAASTLERFDDAVTAPLHGFRNAREYYRTSSAGGFLASIRIPTLLLQSRDDPFLPREAIPEGAIDDNPFLVSALTEEGGHVGFVEGPPWSPRFWADEEGARFLAHHLSGGG